MITREIKGIEPLTSCTQSKNSTTELNLLLILNVLFRIILNLVSKS